MIQRRQVTAALQTLIATATGKPCGRGAIPTSDTGTEVVPPYYLLYPLDGGVSGPPLVDDASDASYVYQVTCVSGPDPAVPQSRGTTDQAEWLADKARSAVLARDPATGRWVNPLTADGAVCMCREIDAEPGATSDPGDAIISYVIRFRFDLTPA